MGGHPVTSYFRVRSGLIMIRTRIWGPLEGHVFYLALDTGATDTMVSADLLAKIGYDLSAQPFAKIRTAGGIIQTPDITVSRLEALGQRRVDFPLLAHDFSPRATVDGVLGLDFLRGHVLNIDFRLGRLTLD